jgi:hypothetical protein
MGSPELAQYADFYADMTRRFGLTDSLELWRDISSDCISSRPSRRASPTKR